MEVLNTFIEEKWEVNSGGNNELIVFDKMLFY